VTVAAEVVEMRWLPGFGSSPGAVDMTTNGPLGPIAKAVTLPEALAASVVIDLLCPASSWYQTVSALAERSTSGKGKP
jgi:hypothetical protein